MKKRSKKVECNDDYHKAGVVILNHIKDKFKNSDSRTEQIMFLSLAPKEWSRRKIVKEFGATEWQARKSIETVKKNGILSVPNSKKGNPLPSSTIEIVKGFYNSDNISRVMSGMNQFLYIKQDNGKRKHIQKRLLLCNLQELHTLFKKEHENIQISFSKFAQLRPTYCILAGSSGTHTVCVCVHHENVKLMLADVNIDSLTKNLHVPIKNYKDCLNVMVCKNFSNDC